MFRRLNLWTFRKLRSVPIFKDFLLIVNAYAWAGDPRFVLAFASIRAYWWRILLKLTICIFLAAITIFIAAILCFDFSQSDIPELNIGLFPNLLGFGIGVYALIFIFPRDLLANLDKGKSEGNRKIGAHGLNTAIAYPLAVFLIILLVSTFMKFLEKNIWTAGVGTFLCYYGLVMCLELISFMLMVARRLISNSLQLEKNHKDKP